MLPAHAGGDRPPSLLPRRAGTAAEAAWGFSVGLAAARLAAGTLEVVAPGTFLGLLGRRGADTPSGRLGFRMKGGRDVGLGLATLWAAARGDVGGVRTATLAAVVIDGVDGWAVDQDAGEVLRFPAHPAGAWLGYAVSAAAAAAVWVLPTPARPG